MNILLIYPDFNRIYTNESSFRVGFNPPALAINLLGEILTQNNYQVEVIDSLRLILRYGVGFHTTFEEEIIRLVKNKQFEIIGISVTSPTRILAIQIARRVKAISPATKLILGGPHITLIGHPFLKEYEDVVDFAIVGEGEKSLPQLLNALRNKTSIQSIPGVVSSTSDGSAPKLISQLDQFPYPAYKDYFKEKHGHLFDTLPVITARGCPHSCGFCYSKNLWGGRFRVRKVEHVLDEIEYGLSELRLKKIHFNDDVFSFPLSRSKAILKGIHRRGLSAQIFCTTRIDCIDEEFLNLYSEVGGGCLYFGIESGSERIRGIMKKRFSNKVIEDGMALIKKYRNIRTGFFLIFGYPTEKDLDIRATERLLLRTEPDEVTCNIAHVHPGTSLFDLAVNEGRWELSQWLKENNTFFPYERNQIRHKVLSQLCAEFENRFGQPIQRNGLIRDIGS